MQSLHADEVVTPNGVAGGSVSRLQLALTDIAHAAREGLLAMAVATGLAVMDELMEDEVRARAGERGAHNPDREVFRHGHTDGEVTLGARRLKESGWLKIELGDESACACA